MTVLITGAAGFIDPALKRARLQRLEAQAGGTANQLQFHPLDIADGAAMAALFAAVQPRGVIHLAAHAGVRFTLEKSAVYMPSTLV